MPEEQLYMQQGIDAARAARNSIGLGWKDSWLNYAAQYALAKQKNAYDLNLWNLMNEYNSPQSQMQRFKEAGLNPMLVYSQGTPGNASSPANSTMPNVQLTPQKDVAQRVAMANDAIGMVSNLAQNITSIFNNVYDTHIKRNEAAWSDLDYAAGLRSMVGFGQGRDAKVGYRTTSVVGPNGEVINSIPNHLNPFSEDFSPLEYRVLSRLGKIPDYFKGYMTAQPQSEYINLRSDYQKYYNEHLLPLFEQYQQGKVDIQAIDKAMQEYNRAALEMIPPEWRGILQPVLGWISPFVKFIFKSSKFKVR